MLMNIQTQMIKATAKSWIRVQVRKVKKLKDSVMKKVKKKREKDGEGEVEENILLEEET